MLKPISFCARLLIALGLAATVTAFADDALTFKYPTFGTIERKDSALDKLLPKNAKLEKVG